MKDWYKFLSLWYKKLAEVTGRQRADKGPEHREAHGTSSCLFLYRPQVCRGCWKVDEWARTWQRHFKTSPKGSTLAQSPQYLKKVTLAQYRQMVKVRHKWGVFQASPSKLNSNYILVFNSVDLMKLLLVSSDITSYVFKILIYNREKSFLKKEIWHTFIFP